MLLCIGHIIIICRFYSYITESVVGLLSALVLDTVGGVRVNYSPRRGHLMSSSSSEAVVKGFTVESVPQLWTAALVPGWSVEARAAVLTRRGDTVVDHVELTPVASSSRQTVTVERRGGRDTSGSVVTWRTVAVRVGKLAEVT